MKQILRIIYAKALIIFSFNAYAQSNARSFEFDESTPAQIKEKKSLTHLGSANREHRKPRSITPDIRRQLSPGSVTLHPNPVIDRLRVDVDPDQWQGSTITIKSRSGKIIAQQRVSEASVRFNLRGVARGIYLLTIRKGGTENTIELVKI